MRRFFGAVLIGLTLGAAVAGAMALLNRPREPSVETLIVRTEQFTAAAGSFTYDMTGDRTVVLSHVPPRTDGYGFTARGAEDRTQMRVTTEYDDRTVEIVRVGSRTAFRIARPPEELSDTRWTIDGAKKGQGSMVSPPVWSALFQDLGAMAQDASVVRHDDGQPVLRFTAPLGQAGALAVDWLAYEAELTVSRGGVPSRLVEHRRFIDPGSGLVHDWSDDVQFEGWGYPVEVTWPSESAIFPSEGVDHGALAAYRAAPLLQPGGIPEGWVLSYAGVLAANRTTEGCEQVELHYVRPDDPTGGYLTLWEFDVPCADPEPPAGARQVRIGEWDGWIALENGVMTAQIVAGQTVVQAHTDLSVDGLGQVLTGLAPLDLSLAPAPVAGLS